MEFITYNRSNFGDVAIPLLNQPSAKLDELPLLLGHVVAVLLGPGEDVMEGDEVLEHLPAVPLVMTTSAKTAVIKRSLGSILCTELCDVLQTNNGARRLRVVIEILLQAEMFRAGLDDKVCHC